MSKIPNNPHDTFAKLMLRDPENARSFVGDTLPSELVAALDLAALEVRPDSYVDAELRGSHADLVYRVPRLDRDGGEDVWVYLLVEHKSHRDGWTLFQLLRYGVRLWEDWQQANPGARLLPPIFFSILYHHEREWTTARRFRDLIDTRGLPDDLCDNLLLDFQPLLRDLNREEDQALARQVKLATGLRLMKYIRSPELEDQLPELLRLLGQVIRAEHGVDYLYGWLRYLNTGASKLSASTINALIDDNRNTPEGDEMATLAEQWIDQGRNEGIKQGIERGIARGIQQGRAQGKAELFLKLAARQWPATKPTPAQRQRIETATDTELEAWTFAIRDANSLAELLDTAT